jgi:peptide/nickel transport system substrate-binding protein
MEAERMSLLRSLVAEWVPLVLVLTACAGPALPATERLSTTRQARTATSQQTLVIAVRGEPPSIASKPLASFSGLLGTPKALFNAELDFRDEREDAQPYLARALPQLNTDSWRVFPDGRMETTYTLKPDLRWQDGQPLVAEDFVFAYRVYATPDLGQASTPPISEIQDVRAPDPLTVLIRWKQLYADAAVLEDGFPPLPGHLLGGPLETLDLDAFSGLPFWSSEYVGLGPYKVVHWEPGAFIEGQAFDGYVFGKPRIDRIRAVFIPDAQTALANVKAGEVHYVSDFVLSVADGQVLEQQWEHDKGGMVLYTPTTLRYTSFQLRPEFVETRALLDARVRTALAYAIDADTAVNVLTAGKGVRTDTLTSPRVGYYPQIERTIHKRGYDPSRARRLMEEAGFTRGPEGFFIGREGQPVQFSVSSTSGIRNEMVVTTYVDSMRRSGFDVNQTIVPLAQMRLPATSAKVPGVQIRGGNNHYVNYTSDAIPHQDNRWLGSNYGGWSDPAYDRAFDGWLIALEPSARVQRIAEMELRISEQVPIIPHFFDVQVNPHPASLEGPVARQTPASGGPFLYAYRWEWRS